MFKDRPGQKRIAENQYEITEDTEGAVIEDTDWESKVQPGTRISMGIIIVVPVPPLLKRDIFGDMELSNRPTNICPRCNILNNGATPIKGYLKCRKCDLVFRAQDTERIVEDLPEDPLEPLTRKRKAPVSEMPKQKTNKQRIEPREPKEEEIFQRIHYRREVSKYPHSQCRGDFCRRACTYRSPKEITLIEAAQRGDTKIVKQLLSDFIDINYNPGCHDSRTLLQAAAEGGHLEVVKLLLSHSADVNGAPAEWGGRTALQAAAGSGHLEVVKLLLSHSADVNAVSAESLGLTALQAAAECGHLEIVKLLLSHSADINAAPAKYSGRTALQAAAEGGHLEVMKLLLSHLADVNDAPAKYSGRTALQAAAEGGHLEVVKLLLSHSADVNAAPAEYHGQTALQAAVKGGHPEVVKLLLSHGADVYAPASEYELTALEEAECYHNSVIKEQLLTVLMLHQANKHQ